MAIRPIVGTPLGKSLHLQSLEGLSAAVLTPSLSPTYPLCLSMDAFAITAGCCTVLSCIGVIFLLALGLAFDAEVTSSSLLVLARTQLTSLHLVTHTPSHPSLHIDYSQVEVLTGSTKLEGDPKTIAKNCYFAAVVYAAFIGFCGFQCVPSPLVFRNERLNARCAQDRVEQSACKGGGEDLRRGEDGMLRVLSCRLVGKRDRCWNARASRCTSCEPGSATMRRAPFSVERGIPPG